MKVTRRSRRLIRIQNVVFVALFAALLGLLAWVSSLYNYQADWTATGRNTLSAASVAVLKQMKGPVHITAFARDNRVLHQHISDLIGHYRRHKQDIELTIVNPDRDPQRVREMGITVDGEMVVEYQGRQQKLQEITERGLSNLLQGLVRGGERRIVFLGGHGERSITAAAGYDLSGWATQLRSKGFKAEELNLGHSGAIPADVSMLVIASPQATVLPGEMKQIGEFIERGGALLWLTDPGPLYGLEPLARQLKLQLLPGIVIDPNVSQVGMQLFGTDDPRVALVARYGQHAVTRNFQFNTLFPLAGGIVVDEDAQWDSEPVLQTMTNTWLETGPTTGKIGYDEGRDTLGPVTLGVALERKLGAERTQRVVVIADGDFLSNGFLGIGGNMQLAMNLVNWLGSDEQLINVPVHVTVDPTLELSDGKKIAIFVGFMLVLPLLLLGGGLTWWWRRRRN
ncbi:MAG: GldG family protein [Gammaproteobacteria bacterium]|nr:GldG family protein [Gammaproteobacteria bacterium]